MPSSRKALRLAFLAGTLAGAATLVLAQAWAAGAPAGRQHRVEIRDDKLDRHVDWLGFLHAPCDEAVATLAREHMFAEAMFRNPAPAPYVLHGREVRDDGGAHADESNLPIDRKHERYMHEAWHSVGGSMLDTDSVLVAPIGRDTIAHWQIRRVAVGAETSE